MVCRATMATIVSELVGNQCRPDLLDHPIMFIIIFHRLSSTSHPKRCLQNEHGHAPAWPGEHNRRISHVQKLKESEHRLMRHHPRLLLLHGFCAGRAHGGIRAPASGTCSDRGNGTMHRSAAWIGSFLADVEHHVRPKEIRDAFGANLEAVRQLLVRERYEEHHAWLPSAWIDAISGGPSQRQRPHVCVHAGAGIAGHRRCPFCILSTSRCCRKRRCPRKR